MRDTCLLLLVLLVTFDCYSQNVLTSHHHFNEVAVFVEKANIRASNSISSEIISTASQGDILINHHLWKADSLEGVQGNWIKVTHNKKTGFIWNHLTANSVFKSQQYLDDVFFVRSKENHILEVKIFNDKQFKHLFRFELNFNEKELTFLGAKSLGQTFNSSGKDIIVVCYAHIGRPEMKYFSWDGLNLEEFNGEFNDESFVSYKRDSSAVIVGDFVKFRAAPNLQSKTIKVLSLGAVVNELKEFHKDTVNGKPGLWSRVTYGKKNGYVWREYLSDYFFYSYKEDDLMFALLPHKILAIKNKKIVATHSKDLFSPDGAHPNGNMGLDGIQDIISLCYMAESCGETSGDDYIGWDGKQFYDFIDGTGVGDGGLSNGSDLTFPSYLNGKKGVVSQNRYDGETIDVPGEEGYQFVADMNLDFDYFFNGDSLEIIPSTYTKIAEYLEQEIPDYGINSFKEGDLNQDGYMDVVLYATSTKMDYGEQNKNKSLVAILMNDTRGDYRLKTFSKTLIEHTENRPLTEIEILKDGFQINIYYSGYYNEDYNNDQYKMVYKYENGEFFLRKATHSYKPEGEDYWEQEDYSYIKNNILFKNSYTPEED